jgi:uncharacterized membrane protein YqaE (UPF0057 family)/PBP1b-binding outer membrane lipoprotein LpoB
MKKTLFILAAFAIFISSCSVEKRLHTDGYHVEWFSNNTRTAAKQQPTTVTSEAQIAEVSPTPCAVEEVNSSVTEEAVVVATPANISTTDEATIIERKITKAERKAIRNAIKEMRNENNKAYSNTITSQGFDASSSLTKTELKNPEEYDVALLVVLAFFLPPLSVYLYEGSWTSRCTTNLILTLLCGLPGLIHALIVVLE